MGIATIWTKASVSIWIDVVSQIVIWPSLAPQSEALGNGTLGHLGAPCRQAPVKHAGWPLLPNNGRGKFA